MKKKIIASVAKIREAELRLKTRREEHSKEIDALYEEIRAAMKVRVVEINDYINRFEPERIKKSHYLKKKISKLEAESFGLRCFISGVC